MKLVSIVVSKVIRLSDKSELLEELLVNYIQCLWADSEKLFVVCLNKGQLLHWG